MTFLEFFGLANIWLIRVTWPLRILLKNMQIQLWCFFYVHKMEPHYYGAGNPKTRLDSCRCGKNVIWYNPDGTKWGRKINNRFYKARTVKLIDQE